MLFVFAVDRQDFRHHYLGFVVEIVMNLFTENVLVFYLKTKFWLKPWMDFVMKVDVHVAFP